MSKDFSDLIYRLARKRTERVLGPAPASGDSNEDAELCKSTQCTRHARREGCKAPSQTVRVRGQVNILPSPEGRSQGGERPPPTLACGEPEF